MLFALVSLIDHILTVLFLILQYNVRGLQPTGNFRSCTEKTEMMLVGSSVHISLVGCESADIGGSCIPFQTTGVVLELPWNAS